MTRRGRSALARRQTFVRLCVARAEREKNRAGVIISIKYVCASMGHVFRQSSKRTSLSVNKSRFLSRCRRCFKRAAKTAMSIVGSASNNVDFYRTEIKSRSQNFSINARSLGANSRRRLIGRGEHCFVRSFAKESLVIERDIFPYALVREFSNCDHRTRLT